MLKTRGVAEFQNGYGAVGPTYIDGPRSEIILLLRKYNICQPAKAMESA
jgi:hypothetical protein